MGVASPNTGPLCRSPVPTQAHRGGCRGEPSPSSSPGVSGVCLGRAVPRASPASPHGEQLGDCLGHLPAAGAQGAPAQSCSWAATDTPPAGTHVPSTVPQHRHFLQGHGPLRCRLPVTQLWGRAKAALKVTRFLCQGWEQQLGPFICQLCFTSLVNSWHPIPK